MAEYKVIRTDFKCLAAFLNERIPEEYPNYEVYQILAEHCGGGAFAVIILKLRSAKRWLNT